MAEAQRGAFKAWGSARKTARLSGAVDAVRRQ